MNLGGWIGRLRVEPTAAEQNVMDMYLFGKISELFESIFPSMGKF